MLATNKALATLPVTGYVIGGALWAIPASYFMKRYGRRAGFSFGSLMGIVGAGICATAVYTHSFELLCAGTLVTGAYSAFAIQYRFAAADMATPDFRAKAISLSWPAEVGGIIARSSKLTKDLLRSLPGQLPFADVRRLLSMVVIQFLRIRT
jgi:MFS family permease